MNRIDLAGRFAIVTGGAGGIGAAIVERLEQSGARVAVWDVRQGAEAPGRLRRIVDITDEEAVSAAMAEAVAAFGALDILVNAAGITGPTGALEDYTLADWRRIVDINLTGSFLATRAAIPAMKAKGYGRIVCIASIAGKEGNPYMAAYSASKAGIIAMVRCLGRELAETGILANAIAPGQIATDILKQMSPESVDFFRSKIPLKRVGEPSEVAALTAWLASADCSFSTGAVYDISGGRAVC
ncbi:SDR family oxidoreductase [Zavarzinia compransoris]|uniref:3-oxoacyl-ACP reductase n=1 Tax=Zavarzinia compransoris TaxID=1264899 RepID=A0A317E6H2_9PROT|nr:SDR family NAD(P)-dependent oxidoreductase [Zavarzinia compransoris]PWR21003.1 3-oxoacyl-ACP reductase [Zavarzinia compransoris]TDP44035.1 3-oxoacyl-[acyl-carrier protein] reductase [Zavarzinia compransoris]